jgi:hypothetical protein
LDNTLPYYLFTGEDHINDPLYPNDIMSSNFGLYDQNPVLDPNHDDYYLLNSNCPDLAESPFLDPLPRNVRLPENVLSNTLWRLDEK